MWRERELWSLHNVQCHRPAPSFTQLNIKYIPSHTPHTNRTPPQHSTPAPRTCPARCLALLSTAPRATLPTTYPLPSTRGASRVRLVRVSARAAPRECRANGRAIAIGVQPGCPRRATRRPRDQKPRDQKRRLREGRVLRHGVHQALLPLVVVGHCAGVEAHRGRGRNDTEGEVGLRIRLVARDALDEE